MRYGMRAFSPEDLETAGRLGLDFVELNLKEPAWVHRHLALINRLRSRLKLLILAHGPEEGNPKDAYGLKQSYLPKVKSSMELAQRVGAKLMTVHLWFDRRYIDQETLKAKVSILRELNDYGRAKRMAVCLENLSEEVEDLVLPFFEVAEIGLTLDIGHGQLMRRQNTSFGFISRMSQRIKHVHVHDNRGGRSPRDDLHLPLGRGVVPIEDIVVGLVVGGYDETITLEVPGEDLPDSLARLQEMVAKGQSLRSSAGLAAREA